MTFWFKFLQKRVSVSTYFDVFSNLILQWLQKYVIAKAGETRGSRTALFLQPFNWFFGTNWSMSMESVVKGSFANCVYVESEKIEIEFDRLQSHFTWLHHVYVTRYNKRYLTALATSNWFGMNGGPTFQS